MNSEYPLNCHNGVTTISYMVTIQNDNMGLRILSLIVNSAEKMALKKAGWMKRFTQPSPKTWDKAIVLDQFTHEIKYNKGQMWWGIRVEPEDDGRVFLLGLKRKEDKILWLMPSQRNLSFTKKKMFLILK